MIDLHLHLDGSLSKEDFIYLAKKNNVDLTTDFPNNIMVSDDCRSLEEYLERFALPCGLLQDEESLSYVTKSLVERLCALNYIYAEIRFAPLLHLEKGLSQVQVIKAVLKGLREGLEGKKDFDANIILCLMRQVDDSINFETIDAAIEVNDPKVVAIDLAGPEGFRPTHEYKALYDKVKDAGINSIIHAGEACGNESILEAIELGAKRIGHGVHLSLDEENVNHILNNNIYFEFCPTSNLQTKSLKEYSDVPLLSFINKGIKVTLNSDNMTVSNTDVYKEFSHMIKTFNLGYDDVMKLLITSLDASFLSEEDKLGKIKVLLTKLPSFYDIVK